MSADSEVRPPDDSWVVALHNSEHDIHPSGSGLVIDRQRILTCAHVARAIQCPGGAIWVAFPKSKKGVTSRSRVAQEDVAFADSDAEVQDLAVLHLREPVPPGVDPVPLRGPASASLLSRRWWAFGFPQGDQAGNVAQGTVGEVLANGLIRIDRKSRYGVESGFSGAGVWSPEYRAVVAVVTEAEGRRGDGRAIPLHHLEACFPGGQIAGLTGRWSAVEAGDVALSAWGWSLAGDPEAERHWSPRARGVASNDERGYRFQGRTAALLVIKDWLGRARDRDHRRMLVVTGAPGAGKSAVLGRIVTTADADAVRELPPSDVAVRATVGSVACAVHAEGKTALEVATEIARAASAELPKNVEDFPRVLHAALARQGRRFNVIIDALDEAVSLPEARNIIRKVILPMTETLSDADARVVAGSRRAGATGDLLGRYRDSSRLVDLGDPEFYAQEDLTAYALATLQLAGDEHPENQEGKERKPNPYADARVAGPVAARIAELSAGNFLVAGLTARTCGMTDHTPKSPDQISFSPRISDVIDGYLELIPEVADIDARDLLTALAFAESPGLPVSLWRKAIQALGYGNATEVQLARFTQTRAASFLIESSEQDGRGTVFRLFHQAVNDALLNADEPGAAMRAEEEALTRAFLNIGRDGGWERAPTYLLRSLPAHAARSGLVDDLLADDDYLLHADLRSVLPIASRAASLAGRNRARLLGLTPEAVDAEPAERAAMFDMTEALDDVGITYRSNSRQVPYRTLWATTEPRNASTVLETHSSGVSAVCAVALGGNSLLAVGGYDGTVQLWNPADGTQTRFQERHQGRVNAICVITVNGQILLATVSNDGTAQLWNPADRTQSRVLIGHRGIVMAVCAVSVGDHILLATVSNDCTIRLWNPEDGTQTRIIKGHQVVWEMCAVTVGDRPLLATGDISGTVQFWDPATGQPGDCLKGHKGEINAIGVVAVNGQALLATGGYDGTVRLWNPADGTQIRIIKGHQKWVTAICAITVDGQNFLATGSLDRTVRLWNPADGTQTRIIKGHQGAVSAICAITVDGQIMLATGCDDHTARILNPAGGQPNSVPKVNPDSIRELHAITVNGRNILVTCGYHGSVEFWNPADGRPDNILQGYQGRFNAACAITINGEGLLATGDTNGTVQLSNPTTGTQTRIIEGDQSSVWAMCAVSVDGQTFLATANSDYAIRLWNPATGTQTGIFKGPQEGVNAICAVTVDGQTFLATASDVRFIRLWNPTTGTQTRTMESHESRVNLASYQSRLNAVCANAVCAVAIGDRPLLAAGINDKTVRLWDPATGRCVLTVPVHHPVLGITSLDSSLVVGVSTGMIAFKIEGLFT